MCKPASMKEQQKWQAEGDADTLSRASEIASDKGRMKRALVASQKKASLVAKVEKKLRETFG